MRKNTLNKKVGHLVKKQRIGKGFTLVELGKKVGLTKAAISNIENGRQRIYLDTIYDMAGVLACNITDLVPPVATEKLRKNENDATQKKGIEWAEKEKISLKFAVDLATRELEAFESVTQIPYTAAQELFDKSLAQMVDMRGAVGAIEAFNNNFQKYQDSFKEFEEMLKRINPKQ